MPRKKKTMQTRKKPGPPPSAPCGTPEAYKRHKRNGEHVDDACRLAYNEWHRINYQKHPRRKATQ